MASRIILGDLSSIGKKSPEAEPLREGSTAESRKGVNKHGYRFTDTATLQELLKDESAMTRFMAATALGERNDESAIPALSEAVLNDANPLIRSATADALGRIGEKPAIAALQKAWSLDKDKEVSWTAASSLDAINEASMTADTRLRESSGRLGASVKTGLAQDDPLVAIVNDRLSRVEAGKDGMTNKQKMAISDSLDQMTARIQEIKEGEASVNNPAGGLVICGSEHIARMLVKVQRDQFERIFGQIGA